MGNIKLLLNTMRKFTPEGQAKIFSALRKTNPDYEEINKLSMSLRGDVVQKGESSKDIIAESLSYFMQNGARECNIMPLANELNQVTQIIQSGMSITKFAQIFSSRKTGLYNFAKKDLQDKNLAEEIKNFNPTGNLEADAQTFASFLSIFNQKIGNTKYSFVYFDKTKNKDLRYVQAAYNELQTCADKFLKFTKLIIPETEAPEVRKLERFLKQQYKFDYIHLENAESAEKVKNALEIAKQKKLPIPHNIVVTPYSFQGLVNGVNRLGSDLKTTVYIMAEPSRKTHYKIFKSLPQKTKEVDIFLAENLWYALKMYSTDKPEHTIMHEFMHSKNPLLLCNKKIPKAYKEVVDNLSKYAKDSFNKMNDEVRNELLTKEVFEGLNKKEKELLNILS